MRRLFAWLLIAGALGSAVGYAQVSSPSARVVPNIRSLNAAASDETVGAVISPPSVGPCRESAVYIVWATGVTSGSVTVETAHEEGYTGTWASLVAVPFAGTAPKVDIVQITGVHAALRTRIDTAVANGTVTTWFTCN